MQKSLLLLIAMFFFPGCRACLGLTDVTGRTELPAANDCNPGCELFERCVGGERSECSITCDYDSDCSSGCCAPLQGGGDPVCARDNSPCANSPGTGGGTAAGGGGGVGGASGAGGSGGCVNTFRVTTLRSYYANIPTPMLPFAANGTGTAVNITGGKAILLTSTATVETVPYFRLQLQVPTTLWKTGTVPVLDDSNTPGFDPGRGAIVRLVYSVGKSNGTEVNDSFWSNLGWGSERARMGQSSGTITITALTPKVAGTISNLQLSGDGYPDLNNFFAVIADGSFCVDPP